MQVVKNRNIKIIIFIICQLFIMSCNQDKNTSEDAIKNDWIKDKNGCLKLRTEKLADSLINKYHLYSKSQKEFIKIFGEGNYKTNNEIYYYFDSECTNYDQIEKNSDKCVFIFEFKKNLLYRYYQSCE